MSGWAKKTTPIKLQGFAFAGRKTRNEREEQKKKEEERRQREEEAAKRAFQEFARDHGAAPDMNSAFETTKASKPASTGFRMSMKSSKPQPKRAKLVLASKVKPVNVSDIFGGDDDDGEEEEAPKVEDTRSTFQKNSNLQRFKEALKQSQEERSARGEDAIPPPVDTTPKPMQTTNLFISGLPMDFNEDKLAMMFGIFGPLASVKIYWPRVPSDYKGYLTGFVAYMTRKHAERAMTSVLRKGINGLELTVDWGKPVPVPDRPFYVHPEAAPLDTTGLPFNAQMRDTYRAGPHDSRNDAIYDAVVKVVIPKERRIRRLIHRTIEFVVRHGPEFEDELAKRTNFDKDFSFLRDFSSSEHVYYRWKLYSILQYERVDEWDEEPYRLYSGGSLWQPPLVDGDDDDVERGKLSGRDRDRLEDRVSELTADADEIADVMHFAITRADAAQEVMDVITESLSELDTPPPLKIARLYLVSDILHNSMAGVANASMYRTGFGRRLPDIFHHLHRTYRAIRGRLRAEQFRKQVLVCLDVWKQWAIFTLDSLDEMAKIFQHGRKEEKEAEEEAAAAAAATAAAAAAAEAAAAQQEGEQAGAGEGEGDLDGKPMEEVEEENDEDEDDLDGKPMDDDSDDDDDSDIDGKPMEDTDSSDDDDDGGGDGDDGRETKRARHSKGGDGDGGDDDDEVELDQRAREEERIWLYGESAEEVNKSRPQQQQQQNDKKEGEDDMFS
ncbi:hypothetical protein PTSG_01136 [Salpingoeca rosetta]|uniref:U2 snRNP-associated SURP motif-containing protein n=1 Tax=Salpingoeca rosetta (strain ATCC 50818 / BSB-021) TaxID=946362 RepID=F2U0X1_SALR5|nr:uncharacterized protein PTSG_01136 [Salpingoeca rosetta]EGD80545.1 hypothetical protein PTSG_01136 [Salpingoeca rosetta]|eukprot:XP_004997106.1 hypothetical protein PTSG_01136 [Salpingoeca rosetta]